MNDDSKPDNPPSGNVSQQRKEAPPENHSEGDDTLAMQHDLASETSLHFEQSSELDSSSGSNHTSELPTMEFDSEQKDAPELSLDRTAAYRSTGERIAPSQNRFEIPGYRILGELGRGGMGVVYKALQLRADRIVALKVMLNSDHAAKEEGSRFMIEARAAARLQHPNIVQVHDVGQAGETPFFTLEFVEGGTLSRRMSKKMLSVHESATMMLTLARAMAYAHERGVIHRDLKPANILVTPAGEPKIADFGLARRTDDVSHLTIDGTILGTPNYMSPEQAYGKLADIGPLSDVYTLGVILFEMLVGRPPFKGATAWEVLQQVRTAEPIPPSTLQPGIPRDLETICLKCLQKEPEKRYGSAALLADDLQRFLNNEPILARPIGSVERLIRLCKRYPREARLVGVVAGLLVLLAVGAIATAYRINADREHITKQRDEITNEKRISDERLVTYRNTVSQLVNRAPNLLQDAPLGAGVRNEFIGIVQSILNDSEDTGAVGPSRQWGLEAVAIRQGELLFSQYSAVKNMSDRREEASVKLSEAEKQFVLAEQIAQAVYDEHPPEVAKAAANLGLAISKRAKVGAELQKPLAEIAPLFKRAIELRREALTADAETSHGPERRAELGMELVRYAEFLLSVNGVDLVRFATRANESAMEATQLLRKAIEENPSDATARTNATQDLGVALLILGQSADRLGQSDAAKSALQECVDVLEQLAKDNPHRYAFQKLLVICANRYGDFLLSHGASPESIQGAYSRAMRALKQLIDVPEIRELQHGENGLAMQFYRNGLAEQMIGRPEIAKQYFEQCAALRELAWLDGILNAPNEAEGDRSITQRIELMLAQARSGNRQAARTHATWLMQRADRLVVDSRDNPQQAGGFDAPRLYLHAAAAFGLIADTAPEAERLEDLEHALEATRKCLANGFQDRAYLLSDPDFAPLQKLEAFRRLAEGKPE